MSGWERGTHMQAIFVGETLLTNTDEADDFVNKREPVYKFLYVCSPEFYTDEGKRYYKIRVRMYQRTENNGGRNIKTG